MNNNLMNLGDYATVIMLLDEVYGGSLDVMIEDIGMQAVIEAAPYIKEQTIKDVVPKTILITLAATGAIAGGVLGVRYILSKKKEKDKEIEVA